MRRLFQTILTVVLAFNATNSFGDCTAFYDKEIVSLGGEVKSNAIKAPLLTTSGPVFYASGYLLGLLVSAEAVENGVDWDNDDLGDVVVSSTMAGIAGGVTSVGAGTSHLIQSIRKSNQKSSYERVVAILKDAKAGNGAALVDFRDEIERDNPNLGQVSLAEVTSLVLDGNQKKTFCQGVSLYTWKRLNQYVVGNL